MKKKMLVVLAVVMAMTAVCGVYSDIAWKVESGLTPAGLSAAPWPERGDVQMGTIIKSLNGYALADEQARQDTAELDRRVDPLEQATESLSGRVDTLEQGTESLSGRVDTLEQGAESLSGRVNTLEQGAESLSGRLDTLEQAESGAAIHDDAQAQDSTWSSQKIAQELDGKLAQETFDRVFYITEPSVNLYQPTSDGWQNTAMILSSGTIKDGYAAYCVTPKIPIEGGKTYTASPSLGQASLADVNRMRCYTSTDAPLGVMELTKNDDGSITFTTPVGSAYILFSVQKKYMSGDENFEKAVQYFNGNFMLVEGTSVPESYVPYLPAQNTLRNIEIPDKSVTLSKIAPETLTMLLPLSGKTVANFGDSIFGNTRPPQDISTYLTAMTGATVYNCAFGGCRMGPHSGHWDAFSMYRLAEAIAAGDYAVQEDALNYDDRTSYAEEPMAAIKSIDFSTLDMLTIAYGTNDFTGNNPINNAENPLDTTTVCGALRYSIETLLTAYPQLRIYVLLPTYRYWKDESGAFVEDSDTRTNDLGHTLVDYVQAIAGVAEAYKLPVIDNYNGLGVNKLNRELYLADGTHHTAAGIRLLAEHIASELW